MAGGVSDILLTSLGLIRPEGVAASSAATRASASGSTADSAGDNAALVDDLTAGLAARLARFSRALSRFVWPSNASSPFAGRLVVADAGLTGKLTASTADSGTAVNPDKYFSAGKSRIAASGVTAGAYTFSVSQGGVREDFSVTVGANDTWGTVLDKVADAVNTSRTLRVQAAVTRQQTPFTLDPSLAATGTVLALRVNPARDAQQVTVADSKGDLLSQLGLTAVPDVASAAAGAVYSLSVDRLAQPTFLHSATYDPGAATSLAVGLHHFSVATGTGTQATSYVSDALDPEAATSLAPGTYSFTVRSGEASRQLSVTVKAGWTWGDVLAAVGGALNGTGATVWSADGTSTEVIGGSGFSLPGVAASTQTVAMPATDGSAGTVAGRELVVTTTNGLADQGLTLTDGTGGLLAALGLTTPYTGEVVSVAVSSGDTWKDVLGNVRRAVSLATDRVDARTVESTVPSYAVTDARLASQALSATLLLQDRRLGEYLTLTDGPSALLGQLGLGSGLPGQDGQITVNGQPLASENNDYALQSGRVRLTATGETGDTLPLAVTRSMDAVSTRLDAVVEAYNGLRNYLLANGDAFGTTLADSLDAPVAANWSGLAAMGFSKTRRAGLLWLSGDAFWRAFANAGAATEQTLVAAPDGLIPAWKRVVATIQAAGAGTALTPETAHLSRVATRRTAADLERTNWLVDWRG